MKLIVVDIFIYLSLPQAGGGINKYEYLIIFALK